jgi:dolichol-phosphate mannosyltransferase
MVPFLTALPVYNEATHIRGVLEQVRRYSDRILVINDGSKDATADTLAGIQGIDVLTHPTNLGYGAALRSAFEFALRTDAEVLVTIDCDGQHEPRLIPSLVEALTDEVDIVSGSRYLKDHAGDNAAPEDRRRINRLITQEVNDRLGLRLTDAFCGFKAYRVSALRDFEITETGYAMPLQVWVQAVAAGMRIVEFPVPRVYLDEKRSFGGSLDDAALRLAHYRDVLDRALATHPIPSLACSTTAAG